MNVSEKKFTSEKRFIVALISWHSDIESPTRESIRKKAIELAKLFNYDFNKIESAVDQALLAIETRMGIGFSLVETETGHDEDWIKHREIPWIYSDAYTQYLSYEGWSDATINDMDKISLKLLGLLQDPLSEGSWDRRGMVIGHVQSGKTANYLSLVSRAADAGYKFIIVIAGVHNNLRKQTQERLDAGFVGRSRIGNTFEKLGVSAFYPDYPHPVTITTVEKDFNKLTAQQSGWSVKKDLNKPAVLVIKKNVSTLRNLITWLQENNADFDGKIRDFPMLIIDDEADNASINTNKEDQDPTKINSLLRQILGTFVQSSYVGYTATPFANIFIRPDLYDSDAYEDLFPRDFIYCLDAPQKTYFGPQKVFIDENSSDAILRKIADAESYIPLSHKKGFEINELPPSLYEAVKAFVIVRAIRNLLGQQNKHCSMLVNVSRFTDIQSSVKTFVSLYLSRLHDAIAANYKLPEAQASLNNYMQDLETVFHNEFENCGFLWGHVKDELYNSIDSIELFVINGNSEDILDYKKYERDGCGLTAIAIGGLSLSRGLTLEGLCISYMYRNTKTYDTLMQMGRWFGYRPGYEELCRVYLHPDSIRWYAFIADASEELRDQILQMRRDKLTPRQFGLYVLCHPDALMITAPNKVRSGKKETLYCNLSGDLRESYILPDDQQLNTDNYRLIQENWKSGFGKGQEAVTASEKGWYILDVNIQKIHSFISGFRVHGNLSGWKTIVLNYLDSVMERWPLADVLLISIKKNNEDESNYMLGYQERNVLKNGNAWFLKKNRVASKGDEKLGLDLIQRAKAEEGLDKPGSDADYRRVRNKPLLMLHMIKVTDFDSPMPAYGISFPKGDDSKGVEIMVNQIWVEQFHGNINEYDDSEDE